jgi:hypothetical protein
MRSERELPGWPTVEFVDEPAESSAADEMAAVVNPARSRAIMAGSLVVMLLAFAVVGHNQDSPMARRTLHAHARTQLIRPPSEPLPAARDRTASVEWPSLAIAKAFAAHIPGSAVISEHTSLTNRGQELRSRVIRALSGNAALEVVISRPTRPLPSHATRIMQGSYAITIRSTGYYAPTRKQLHRLAADHRLTAVV